MHTFVSGTKSFPASEENNATWKTHRAIPSNFSSRPSRRRTCAEKTERMDPRAPNISVSAKSRFSNRVTDYIKSRPSYPPEAIDFLIRTFNIARRTVVADIGSGTGILTRLLAPHVSIIYAVEPNLDMRAAGEASYTRLPSIISVNGSAESTTLPGESVDLITSAQAFHWFDREKTGREFHRILKPDGCVTLLWNTRLTDSEFLERYDELLKRFGTDYAAVDHRNIDESVLRSFFRRGEVAYRSFSNIQSFDFEGLIGRLNSSSYAPLPGDSRYIQLTTHLHELFARHHMSGKVDFHYSTDIYWGTV